MKLIKSLLYKLESFRWMCNIQKCHKKEICRSCTSLNLKLKKATKEDSFVNNWKVLFRNVDVTYYRYYSSFIGEDINILPDDIFHLVIEPILNNPLHYYVYADKNMYGKILPKQIQPKCLLRKMRADYLDENYLLLKVDERTIKELISENEKVISLGRFIVKPTVDSMGGVGVRLFNYDKNKKNWFSNDGLIFNYELLEKTYKKDFIIQECVNTSDFVKQFNPDSFSTFRVITYRSVVDDKVHILGAYMRVGPKGSFKDNVHCGGYAIPIDEEGKMYHYGIDENRKRYSIINGIDLSQEKYIIPHFTNIKQTVYDVASKMTNHRLISFDVILDNNNNPKIIEFNLKSQTITTIQATMYPFFRGFTEEVLEYCKKNLNNIPYLKIFEK